MDVPLMERKEFLADLIVENERFAVSLKRMADEDFVICGYVPGKMPSVILGEFVNEELKYAGTVTMGVKREDLKYLKKGACPLKDRPKGDEIVWCVPEMVCTVEYMPNTKDVLRQPVYTGIRTDYRLGG